MDKYEYRVKTEQMLEYTEKKDYKKAMEIADTIDWRRVKNPTMLNTVSEIYEFNGEFQKSRDILFVAYDRAPSSRKIIYRLGTLALKIDDTEEASDCYEEFVKVAPKDPNQYILKYRILKAQRAALSEQIAALEDFKKAEYVEKWAYELANLYHEAGMTAECLEECDDLILWFSEGKYVYQAMELKMKYKPLTPLQQEKYDSRPGAKPKRQTVQETFVQKEIQPEKPEETKAVVEEVTEAEPVTEENVEPESIEAGDIFAEIQKEEVMPEAEEIVAEETVEEVEEIVEEEVPQSSITKVIKGATLEEALANGVAMASGINIEEKAMVEKDEQLRISGQMKIEEILQEWEEKQKQNAEAIEKQKQEDTERLRKEREEAERRQEAERLERERRAAEAEAARKAAEEEAARKAAEEEAARKAAEEEAARKAAEEEAARAAEEAARKAAEEEKILEGKTQRLPDDILELVEQLESRVADSKAAQMEEEEMEFNLEDAFGEEDDSDSDSVDFEDVETYSDEDFEDDLTAVEADEAEEFEEDEYDEDEYVVGDFEEAEYDEDEFDEFEEAEAEYDEDEFEEAEAEYDEDEFEEAEAEYDEDEFEEAEAEYDEDEFEEVADEYDEDEYDEFDEFEEAADEYDEDDFDEFDDFEESADEYDEDEFDEFDEFEESADEYDEDEFDEFEEAADEYDEDEFDEFDEFEEAADDYDEDEFEEANNYDEEFDLDSFFEDDLPKVKEPEEVLEIEEPSEEEIQKRIKKSKGSGVPFDTGFVVTGRYDLSATSEIGLKAGLTEEQKKLFSYFVPVRGMSEQIVEVLDNDRRAQREGTSKTGNLLVLGRKGSGKTVLAVDIVKAIQKQRNLKQGKVAIVTGESLNKKELSNIVQKLRGGAIIVEKAGKLNSRTVKELNHLMEKKTGEMLFVLEDQRKPLERVLTANPEFKKKFTSKLELPVFINDELVTFGQTYAKENGYKLDEMGILALYSRIDVMQREDHAVTVAEVKDIMDEAIQHSQKANVKHLARRVFGKSTDSSDRIILKEEDFRI